MERSEWVGISKSLAMVTIDTVPEQEGRKSEPEQKHEKEQPTSGDVSWVNSGAYWQGIGASVLRNRSLHFQASYSLVGAPIKKPFKA